MKKQFALLFLSLLLLTAFFLMPGNRRWAARLMGYGNDIRFQSKYMHPDQRMARRFRLDYSLSKQIADTFHSKKTLNPLVILPPSSSFKNGGLDYIVPEPAVFYYFTGLRTVSFDGPMAMKASWMVAIDGKNIRVEAVKDTSVLKDSITSWLKKAKP